VKGGGLDFGHQSALQNALGFVYFSPVFFVTCDILNSLIVATTHFLKSMLCIIASYRIVPMVWFPYGRHASIAKMIKVHAPRGYKDRILSCIVHR